MRSIYLYKASIVKLLLIAFVACVTPAHASDVSFTVNAPRQVVEGNQFKISYILQNAEGSSIKAAEIEGATLLYGPATSTSRSMEIRNGKTTSSYTQQYTYTYRAVKAGKYTVEPATVMVDGKAMKSKSFSIEILPPDQSAQNSGNQSQSVQIDNVNSQRAGQAVTANDIFVRINLSKSHVYEQEALICSIKLYTKYQISSFMSTQQPSFNGFLIEEMPNNANLNEIEHYNGQNYMVAELRKYILYPQQSGQLTITSGSYDVAVIQYEEANSFFGMIRTPVEKQIKVQSNQASLNVTPLPTPKPNSFTGAVGNFKIAGKLNTDKFKTNEAATYTLSISGTGNIKFITTPSIDFPSQFEVYDPQNTNNVSISGNNMTGTQKWEYTFIPQYDGQYKIPAIEFSYFDTASKKYVTLSTTESNVSVEKGTASASTSSVAINKSDIVEKNKDILHIRTGNLYLTKSHKLIVSSSTYWLWYIIPTLILCVIMFAYRKTLKNRSNVQLMRTKKAGKIAKKRLKTAKTYMESGNNNAFYAEMLKAIWGYLSDKLHIPVSGLNKENIETELLNYGASQELTSQIINILDECEFAQYAPSQSNDQMESIYEQASDVMDKLENTKKK